VLEESVIIDNTNKQSFFIIDLPTEQEQDVTEEIKTMRRLSKEVLLVFIVVYIHL
jgi:hypothetical protein